MGLDMYLLDGPSYESKEIGYWRKANAIHAWFVEHVQGGEDDCGYSPVSKEQLQELLDTVNTVLAETQLVVGKVNNGYTYKNGERVYFQEDGQVIENTDVATALLPTQSGFFFGSTDYDEYYLKDLEHTKGILEEALRHDSGEYYYHSSW